MHRRSAIEAIGGTVIGAIAGCLELGADEGTERTSATSREGWKGDVSFSDVDAEVYVEARSFYFSPGTETPVVVTAGETVGLAFTSLDSGYHSGHGLGIEAFGIALQAPLNYVESTTFTPDRVGEFEIRCTVYCGSGHDDMTGRFVVE